MKDEEVAAAREPASQEELQYPDPTQAYVRSDAFDELLEAAKALLDAKNELRQFESENPNNTTKKWEARLWAVGDAEDWLREVVSKAESRTHEVAKA